MKQTGLTLVELLITLAVLAILVGIAAPSFMDTIEQNRIRASLQDFSTYFKYARSEAVKQSSTVTICASSNQSSCTGTWSGGWIVFRDIDGDHVVDSGDTLLRVAQSLESGYALTFTDDYVTFTGRGYTDGQSGTFKLCGREGEARHARGLILMVTGSLRFSTDSNGDGVYEDASGTAFSC